MSAERTIEEWEKKLGIKRTDPNFQWHIEQVTANDLIEKPNLQYRIIPAGKPLKLHKPTQNAPIVYGEGE